LLPEYILDGDLRRVSPYPYTYKTYAKGRWLSRTLFDLFCTEFRDRSIDYYRDAIERGAIIVNGERVALDYKIQESDVIAHTMHRHEPPVTSRPIRIVHECDDFLVVDKPASMPVHPTGRYHFNTVLGILEHVMGYSNLYRKTWIKFFHSYG
jgi:tRNA pseudouridine synthase 9